MSDRPALAGTRAAASDRDSASPCRERPEVRIVMLRHGPTAWNASQRIQGHTDVPLAPKAARALTSRRLPARFAGFGWIASPLQRAVQTARLVAGRTMPESARAHPGDGFPAVEPRLREMSWGRWEGRTIAAVRDELGAAKFDRLTAQGPDFRPPGGESPRELQARLLIWMAALPSNQPGVVAVTHKGVLKAMLGLAFGWNLTGKAPIRLQWDRIHEFSYVRATAQVVLLEPNIPLVRPEQVAGDRQ